jgi:hypothetical protein
VSELAVISSRIGEELDQQVRARALRGTHHCRSVGQSVCAVQTACGVGAVTSTLDARPRGR